MSDASTTEYFLVVLAQLAIFKFLLPTFLRLLWFILLFNAFCAQSDFHFLTLLMSHSEILPVVYGEGELWLYTLWGLRKAEGEGGRAMLTRARFAWPKKFVFIFIFIFMQYIFIGKHTHAHILTRTLTRFPPLYSYSFAFGIQRIFEYLQRKLMDKFADISCSRRGQFNKEPKPMASLPFPCLPSATLPPPLPNPLLCLAESPHMPKSRL